MRQKSPFYAPAQRPIVVLDRAPFIRGFLLGSLVALTAYSFLLLHSREASQSEVALTVAAVLESQTPLAIARAEEINDALTAYVESCGTDLANLAWSEAGVAQERYQLLSSFIPFSPDSLAEYMPDDFEIVLWDDLAQLGAKRKVDLLVAGVELDY
ncbi:MAG: hypothetical protein ACR2RV_22595 [Verrucomicrobiales bacterium]